MCLLGSCFKQLPRLDVYNVTYEIPKASREDLALLACLSPFMFTHLTAEHSDALVCADSIDSCLGAVESPVSTDLHREL